MSLSGLSGLSGLSAIAGAVAAPEEAAPPHDPLMYHEPDSFDVLTNGSAISTWTDKSGNGYNLTGTLTARPVVATSALGAHSAADFDGSNDVLQVDLSPTEVEFTQVILVKWDANAEDKSFAGARGTTGGTFDAYLLGVSGTSTTPAFRRAHGDGSGVASATGPGGTYNTTGWFLVVARSTGTTSTAVAQWINSVARGTGSSANVPLTMDRLVLGAGHFNNAIVDFSNCKIVGHWFYDEALSLWQIQNVEDYVEDTFTPGVLPAWSQGTDLDSDSGALDCIAFDIDGDGDDEFISGSSSSSPDPHLRIYKHNGTDFVKVKDVISAAAINAKQDRVFTRIAVADIDGDGDFEIIAVDSGNEGTSGSLLYWKHDGSITGTWTEHVIDTWSGSGAGNIVTHAECVTGSLTNNGKMDIVVRDISHGVWIFPNTTTVAGTATFGTRRFVAVNPREGLALADIYGNSRKDIVLNGVALETPADLASGTFTLRAMIGLEDHYPGGASATQIDDYACKVVVGTLDDGGQVVVISNAEEGTHNSPTKPLGVKAYKKPADPISGTWTVHDLIDTDFCWHTLVLHDIAGTGKLSALAARSEVGADTATAKMTWWAGNGDGTFDAGVDIDTTNFVYSACIGTVDGKTVLFAPENWNNGEIRVYRKR